MSDPRATVSAWLPHLGLLAAVLLGLLLAASLLLPVLRPVAVAAAVVLLTHDVLYAPLASIARRLLPARATAIAQPIAAAVSVAALFAGAIGAGLLILWSALGGLRLTAVALLDVASQDPQRIQRVAERLAHRADDVLKLYPGLPWTGEDVHQAINSVLSHLALGPQVMAYLATGTGSLLVELALTALAATGLYLHGPRLGLSAMRILPIDHQARSGLRQRLAERTNDLVTGTIARAIALGTCHGLTAWLIGGFSPVLVAAVAIIAVLLPLIGSAFVWLPLASLLAGQGHWGLAIALAMVQQGSAWTASWLSRHHASAQPLSPMGFTLILFLIGAVLTTGVRGLVLAPAAVLITMTLVDALSVTYGPGSSIQPNAPATPEQRPNHA